MKNYIFKKKSLKMTTLVIVFDAGARLEQQGKYGTMHLMEHLICKTFKDMYPELTKLGISWNAFTSDEMVEVYFKGLDKYLTNDLKEKLARRLVDGLSWVSEEEFETEKKVVCQEYADCMFSPESASTINIMRKWFGVYTPIGYLEDIQAFTYEDMLETYEKYFRKPVKITEIGRYKTEVFENFDYQEIEKTQNKVKFKKHNDMPLEEISSDDKIPVFAVSKKIVSKSDYPYLGVGLDMLTDGLESPFYKELREKLGLTYFVCTQINCYIDHGVMMIEACTGNDRKDELIEKMQELIATSEQFLSKERFNTIMSSVKIQRETQDALLFNSHNRFSTISKMLYPNNLNKIELDKVIKVTLEYLSKTVILTAND